MPNQRLCGIIEAILFVCGEAMPISGIADALGHDPALVIEALDEMETLYRADSRGLQLKRFANQVQLVSKPDYATYVERILHPAQRQSLSQAALETLVIVAYRQPVTRQEVEAVRGVKADYSLQTLTQKGLIREGGRRETLGRPILYITTDLFLSHFGLSSLKDLPEPPDAVREDGDNLQLRMDMDG